MLVGTALDVVSLVGVSKFLTGTLVSGVQAEPKKAVRAIKRRLERNMGLDIFLWVTHHQRLTR